MFKNLCASQGRPGGFPDLSCWNIQICSGLTTEKMFFLFQLYPFLYICFPSHTIPVPPLAEAFSRAFIKLWMRFDRLSQMSFQSGLGVCEKNVACPSCCFEENIAIASCWDAETKNHFASWNLRIFRIISQRWLRKVQAWIKPLFFEEWHFALVFILSLVHEDWYEFK